jgi:hypothetical protein
MSTKWRNVPLDSLDTVDKPSVASIALSHRFHRLLKSPSGLSAIVLRKAAISSCPGLVLAWQDEPIDYHTMSIVVPGVDLFAEDHQDQFDILTQEQCGVIYALRKISDVIALPNDFTDRDWHNLQSCGSLAVADAPASYTLFQDRPTGRQPG